MKQLFQKMKWRFQLWVIGKFRELIKQLMPELQLVVQIQVRKQLGVHQVPGKNQPVLLLLIFGQTKSGSGLWHVSGSPDGRWAVGDDFARNIYLIDRHTREMILLSAGHKTTAADHPHPTMSPDGTKIQIQSAMLSADNRTMNICIIPVPEEWLKRIYK